MGVCNNREMQTARHWLGLFALFGAFWVVCAQTESFGVASRVGSPQMAKGIAQIFTYVPSDKVPGQRVRRGLLISASDDLEARVRHFCTDEQLPVEQCPKLYDNMKVRRQAQLQKELEPTTNRPSLHLIVQYYNDKNAMRASEVDACLRFNLANPHVLQVHVLKEPFTVMPREFAGHPKLKIVHRDRMTFQMAFEYANTLPYNSTACLSNADIYLDHQSPWHQFTGNLEDMGTLAKGKYALSLSRVESNTEGHVWLTRELQRDLAYSYSQDAWVFKTPIIVQDADFTVGNCPGSDNAIADRLFEAGRRPINFPQVWRIFHLDSARKKFQDPGMVYTNKTDRSHPERRGFRVAPSFAEVRQFSDLVAHKWSVDPILEYIHVTDYLAESTHIGHPGHVTYDRESRGKSFGAVGGKPAGTP